MVTGGLKMAKSMNQQKRVTKKKGKTIKEKRALKREKRKRFN